MMLEASRRVMPWRATVAACASAARIPMHDGDVSLRIRTLWTRPSAHLTRSGGLRRNAPARPGYADCDKIARAVCDALAGIAYRNDRQVAMLAVERRWCEEGESPGALISVEKIEG